MMSLLRLNTECLRKLGKDLRALAGAIWYYPSEQQDIYRNYPSGYMVGMVAGGRKGLAGQLVCVHCIIDSNNINLRLKFTLHGQHHGFKEDNKASKLVNEIR